MLYSYSFFENTVKLYAVILFLSELILLDVFFLCMALPKILLCLVEGECSMVRIKTLLALTWTYIV